MRNLIDLKNKIAKQLPRMPRNYIVRLTMDIQHEAMIIRKKYSNGDSKSVTSILGDCNFRPFRTQHFAEIVFLAISTSEQVKGYGTRLMNRLKDHAQTVGIRYFVIMQITMQSSISASKVSQSIYKCLRQDGKASLKTIVAPP